MASVQPQKASQTWPLWRTASCAALLVAAGSCAGLLLGIAASRLLAVIVYGANALDPAVLLGALGTMGLVGLGSALLPARRALAVNPARLLREE